MVSINSKTEGNAAREPIGEKGGAAQSYRISVPNSKSEDYGTADELIMQQVNLSCPLLNCYCDLLPK